MYLRGRGARVDAEPVLRLQALLLRAEQTAAEDLLYRGGHCREPRPPRVRGHGAGAGLDSA